MSRLDEALGSSPPAAARPPTVDGHGYVETDDRGAIGARGDAAAADCGGPSDALYTASCYNALVSARVMSSKVSNRGQTSLPAELRHRWGIETGGEVAFIDLGDAALVLPGGTDRARSELRRVLAERYEAGLALIDDPDLADQ